MKTRRNKKVSLKHEFPFKKNVDYSLLIITPEGEYSMTKRKDGERLIAIMKAIFPTKTKSIADLTGNVGSDTILFGLHFRDVVSVEIDAENYKALKNNVGVFGLKNVKVIHGDSTHINWNTDAVYIDAPWGGPDYKTKTHLDLYLGKERLDLFIKKLHVDHIFLKVPKNYNFDRLDMPYKRFPIRNFYLVSI